jgi:hypothetical protein
LVDLVVWWIRNNQLITIPAEIGHLVNLQSFDLSYNQLTTIPAEIGQLVGLHDLYLAANQLTTIPAEIGQLAKLGYLTLWNNPIICIPHTVYNHARWYWTADYQMCPTEAPTACPSSPTAVPTIGVNSTNGSESANLTTTTPLIKPTLMRSRLPPFAELYDRANTPATKRLQSSIGSSKSASNAQSGDEIKSKINKMREKVAVMRGEL